jgi:hypothetical protein
VAASLVAGTDASLRAVVASFPYEGGRGSAWPRPYSVGDGPSATLILTARTRAYDLAALRTLKVVEALPDGSSVLVRPVVVGPGAVLNVDAPGGVLRLRSEAGGFVSIVSWYGSVTFRGARDKPLVVTSWDLRAGAADAVVADGRAFVRQVGGRMDLEHVTARHLGFWSGRTGGVAWTGSARSPSSGTVIESTFEHNHYGAFASRSAGLEVTGSAFVYNAVDGLALHRGSTDAVVAGATSGANGRHGVAVARGTRAVVLRDLAAVGNGGDGVRVDIRPLSRGLSAGGASLTGFGDVQVLQGRAAGNGGTGVRVVQGRDVAVRGMALADNAVGIEVEGTNGVTVAQNMITGPAQFGIDVTGGASAVSVSGNTIAGSATGVRVRDSAVHVAHNSVAAATEHGISVHGASTGSVVQDNAVAGRGGSGLDFYRLADGAKITATGNVDEQWSRNRLRTAYWITFVETHPTLLLWLLVLIMPIASQVRAQRFDRQPLTAPYLDQGEARATFSSYSSGVVYTHTADVIRASTIPGTVDTTDGPATGPGRTRVTVVLPR